MMRENVTDAADFWRLVDEAVKIVGSALDVADAHYHAFDTDDPFQALTTIQWAFSCLHESRFHGGS